ncbi:cohesin subunit SA-3-like, partial [Corvus hawaiiensis]|uniref:cohesin subunit SA-3-like n=1 Tax=Corvus hawaiiensis TaxID=134902 RepID=UPI00201891F2
MAPNGPKWRRCPLRDHDLTPWGLFEPCWRLLRRATDTGEVPAQVTIPAISCLFFHLLWELSRIPESGAPPAQLRDFRSRAASFCSWCRSCLGEPQPGLRQAAFLVLCDLLVLLGPGQPREPLRLQPEPELPAQLGAALMDLVFRSQPEAGNGNNGNSGNSGNSGNEASEGHLEELHQRRLLLAAFCKLLLQGVLELRAASDVFKHYSKFHDDYGDVIRKTLRAARELDRLEWARTVLLSLQQ